MKTLAQTLLIILLLSFFSQSAVAAVLEKVTSQSLEDGQEMVNLFFTGHSEPKIFSLPGDSPRLVFDFPDTRYLGQQKIAVDGAVLHAIRISTHPNPLKTRVVFDLRAGAGMDYNQEFLQDGHTLRISLSGKGATLLRKAVSAPPQTARPVGAPVPVKKEATVSPPLQPKAEQPNTVSPSVQEETVASLKTASPAKPPIEPPLAAAGKSEGAVSGAAATVASSPTEPKGEQPVAVLPPEQEKTASPLQAASPVKSPTEPPLATAEKSEKPVSGAAKSATSSPFDNPLLSTESPTKPTEKTGPAAATTPAAVRMLGYSLVNQPADNDLLRLQLDGYADPEITAHEGGQPQIVCFFPKMRLAVKKESNQRLSGKFIRKMVVTAQGKPPGIKMVLDLEGGYDYYIQKIFNTDELAYFLVVNRSSR